MKRRETATAGQQTTHGADDNVDESAPSADFSSTPLASKMKLFSISEEYFGAMPQRRMPQRWISIDKTTHTQKLFKNNCISPLSFFLSFFLSHPSPSSSASSSFLELEIYIISFIPSCCISFIFLAK